MVDVPGPGAPAEPVGGATSVLAAFDTALERVTDRMRNPALDRVLYALSSAADHSLLWLAAGSVRAALRHDPLFAARLGVSLGIESLLTNVAVKSFFRRVRPERPPTDHPDRLPYGMRVPITSAFPSGHATAAFTAAAFLGDTPGAASLWYPLAALVAWSRVYVRMHHPSDVVAGAALGLVLGRVLVRASERVLA